MSYFNKFNWNLLEAVSSIRSNKLRVFLTAAIISIGIASLVGILTSIDGIKNSVSDSFSELGSNVYNIRSVRNDRGRKEGVIKKNYPVLRYREIAEFLKRYQGNGIPSVSTTVTRIAELKYKSEVTNPNISVEAGDHNLSEVNNLNIKSGRFFTKSENDRGMFVTIIGSGIKSSLFKNNEDPLNKFISVRGSKFKVIGILDKQGSSFGGGGDNRIIIPIETSRKLRPTANYEITVFVDNIERINDDINYSQNLFKILRGDMIGSENSFEIERNESLDAELDEISTYLKIGGFTIGFITLLGASIGLMNIMLVSVTERTREIGLRKSIGATPKIIRDQFLIESILICLIGGFGGVTLGILFGNLVTIFIGGGSFIIPWIWVVTGLLISTLVGILSGYIPAMKASALDPIESLRFE
ncbi:MAG: ABC transporter [Cytophagia bacterium]|nr:ABC transporter [Cytophagia bacterium]